MNSYSQHIKIDRTQRSHIRFNVNRNPSSGTPWEITLVAKDIFGVITINTIIQIGSDNIHPATEEFLPFHVDDVTEKIVFTEIEVVDVMLEDSVPSYTGIMKPLFLPFNNDFDSPSLNLPDNCEINPATYGIYNEDGNKESGNYEILKENFESTYGLIIVIQSGNPTEWAWCRTMEVGTQAFKIRGYYI